MLILRSSVRNQTESPLLRLPPEIRQMIFAYVLESASLFIYDDMDTDRTEVPRTGLHLPQVCRQIQRETKHLVDNFLYLSLDGSCCICAWDEDFDRRGHDARMVLELRLSSSIMAKLEDGEFDHGEGTAGHGFPSLQRVICESPQVSDVLAIRSLFGKADLEVMHVKVD